MRTTKKIALTLSFLILSSLSSVYASEKDELALILIQLSQIESTLDRAQAVSSTDRNERYYFDYKRAKEDINTIRTGINGFLAPSRAQPSNKDIIGKYKGDK